MRDVNVKLIEMAQANTDAVFGFARGVAEAKAPSDLVQVWTTHATKQFDMLTKQASNLTTLGQQFAGKAKTVARRASPSDDRSSVGELVRGHEPRTNILFSRARISGALDGKFDYR
jgi:phasin protein